jgi:hypothetical protein
MEKNILRTKTVNNRYTLQRFYSFSLPLPQNDTKILILVSFKCIKCIKSRRHLCSRIARTFCILVIFSFIKLSSFQEKRKILNSPRKEKTWTLQAAKNWTCLRRFPANPSPVVGLHERAFTKFRATAICSSSGGRVTADARVSRRFTRGSRQSNTLECRVTGWDRGVCCHGDKKYFPDLDQG